MHPPLDALERAVDDLGREIGRGRVGRGTVLAADDVEVDAEHVGGRVSREVSDE